MANVAINSQGRVNAMVSVWLNIADSAPRVIEMGNRCREVHINNGAGDISSNLRAITLSSQIASSLTASLGAVAYGWACICLCGQNNQSTPISRDECADNKFFCTLLCVDEKPGALLCVALHLTAYYSTGVENLCAFYIGYAVCEIRLRRVYFYGLGTASGHHSSKNKYKVLKVLNKTAKNCCNKCFALK
jgi:hypothetical protein